MSSPSSSSSATAGRLRWTRRHLPQRRAVIEWGAAALAAAALYTLPVVVLRLEGGLGWWLQLAAVLAVLAAYAHWRASPLAVLGLAVAVAIAWAGWVFLTVSGDSCGSSHIASVIESIGEWVALIALGAAGLRRRGRSILLVPGALLVAGLWIVAVAHMVPGGTGACLN
jgi:hypothetical protein